jgi:hypothetical protein
MLGHEYDAAVAAFIRTKGITRCPTACALPTQATIAARDRTALEEHAAKRERRHGRKTAPSRQFFRMYRVPDRR